MGGGSKTTTSNQNEQASTVPQTPAYAQDPVKNYYAGINNYQQSDPYQYVTPANSLQTAAYGNASGLFGANNLYGQAAAGAQGVMGAAPTAAQAQQTQAQVGTLGPASTASAQYAGAPVQATAANAGQATQGQASSLLDNLAAYQNPLTEQVVNTTLADFDANSALVRGQQQADAARNGAFGGSRYGYAQAATEDNLARGRASTDANLRFNAFNTAAGLSGQDADRRQNVNLFNADAANQYGLANSGYQQQANLANAGAANDVNALNAQLGTQTSQFNAGAQNQFGLAQFGANNDQSQFNAGQANQLGQFNAGQANQMQDSQLNRTLQASGLLGDLASNYGSNYRADLATQADLGNQLYQVQNQYTNAPLTQLQNVGNLLNPGLIDSLSGKTITSQNSGVSKEKTSGGLFNSLLGIGSLGASVFSDRRLKQDIRRVGATDAGAPIYTYRYKGDDRMQMGVMAQDIEQMQPEALGPEIGGFKTVNYERVI